MHYTLHRAKPSVPTNNNDFNLFDAVVIFLKASEPNDVSTARTKAQ